MLANFALRTKLMGGDDQEQWEQMKRLYASLFSDAIPKVPEEDVPPRLKDLFTYVAATREEGLNIFGNGAGKSFAKEILGLLPIKRWVRTSTTPTSQIDCCGVVDVAVVKGGAWLVVGEIKGGLKEQSVEITFFACIANSPFCHNFPVI